jgi:hypothetical protein
VTGDVRVALKHAIDQHTRQRVRLPDACKGCGGEYTNVTAGCPQCSARAHSRAKRARDERRERLLSVMPTESRVNRQAHAEAVGRMIDGA